MKSAPFMELIVLLQESATAPSRDPAEPIQHPASSILILSSYLILGLQNGLFLSFSE